MTSEAKTSGVKVMSLLHSPEPLVYCTSGRLQRPKSCPERGQTFRRLSKGRGVATRSTAPLCEDVVRQIHSELHDEGSKGTRVVDRCSSGIRRRERESPGILPVRVGHPSSSWRSSKTVNLALINEVLLPVIVGDKGKIVSAHAIEEYRGPASPM